jgi:crossover junction endodeoxyribonuclease RusA
MQARLPYPPSINDYYGRSRKTGAVYLKKPARIFRKQVAGLLYGRHRFGSARLAIRVDLFPPRYAGDVDNPIKALLDALEHAGTFDNDKQVKDLRMVWRHPVSGGAVEIQVWEI